jgi:hypothetical protein
MAAQTMWMEKSVQLKAEKALTAKLQSEVGRLKVTIRRMRKARR